MSLTLGLMGFGRLGRNMFRIAHDDPEVTFAAVSDIASAETLAYLTKNTTVEGLFQGEIRQEGHSLVTARQRTRVVHGDSPGDVPWDVLGADIVIEATGQFRTRELLQRHIDAGAKGVLLSTPSVGEIDRMVINGINDHELTAADRIVSNGSSSCHALALVLKVLQEEVGLKRATMTTVHAYTSDQQLSDTATGGLRWSRSAAENIIPNSSWAASAVVELMPELAGRVNGFALNVPVSAGSNLDLVVELEKPLTAEEYNAIFAAAATGKYKGLLGYTTEPIVSSDVIGSTHSAVFDGLATLVMDGKMVKAVIWFDNGWGYSARAVELMEKLESFVRQEVKA